MRSLIQSAVVGVVLLIGMSLGASPSTVPAAAGASQSPRQVVEQAVNASIAALRDPALSPAGRADRVVSIADDQIDFQTLARLTLGGSWKDLSDAQAGEFVQLFRKHVLGVYRPTLREYGGQNVDITADQKESRGDWSVQSLITDDRGPGGARRDVAKLAYRLRQTDGRWKVIDLNVEGVSLAAIFRAQFQTIVVTKGPEHLLQLLREKNAKTDATEKETRANE